MGKYRSKNIEGNKVSYPTKEKPSIKPSPPPIVDKTEDEPVYNTTDEPVYHTSDEPVYNTTDEPVYHTSDEPVYHTTDKPSSEKVGSPPPLKPKFAPSYKAEDVFQAKPKSTSVSPTLTEDKLEVVSTPPDKELERGLEPLKHKDELESGLKSLDFGGIGTHKVSPDVITVDESVEGAGNYKKRMEALLPKFNAVVAADIGKSQIEQIREWLDEIKKFKDEKKYLDAVKLINETEIEITKVSEELGILLPLIGKRLIKENIGEEKRTGEKKVHYAEQDERSDASVVMNKKDGTLSSRSGKGAPLEGTFGYVVSQDDGLMGIFKDGLRSTETGGKIHHSTLIRGTSAAGAGEVDIEKGVIRRISDKSGHYRPETYLTHQIVERLIKQGVAMTDIKLAYPSGEPVTDGSIIKLYEEVHDFHKDIPVWEKKVKEYDIEYQKKLVEDKDTPYDLEIGKLKSELAKAYKIQDLGVSPANRDAKVEVFDPRVYFSEDEWVGVKGNKANIVDAIQKKIGWKGEKSIPSEFSTGNKINPNDRDATNDYIGVLLRACSTLVDKKLVNAGMKAGMFTQTGGNMDQVKKKKLLNEEIESARKDTLKSVDKTHLEKKSEFGEVKFEEYSKERFEDLGGKDKLLKLGKNLSKLTLEQQFMVLSEAVELEAEIKRLGGRVKLEELLTGKEIPEHPTLEELRAEFEILSKADYQKKIYDLGGADRIHRLGKDPSKLTLKQQFEILSLADKSLKKIDELGGEDKLRKLGKDPSKLTLKEQLKILTEAKEYQERIDKLGGPDKLSKLVEAPDKLTPKEQFMVLSEAVELEAEIKRLGGIEKLKALLKGKKFPEDPTLKELRVEFEILSKATKFEAEIKKLEKLFGEEDLETFFPGQRLSESPTLQDLRDYLKSLTEEDYQRKIYGLGGEDELRKLGKDPSKLTLKEQLEFLTEAKEYWEKIEKLGGADRLRKLGKDPSKLTLKEQFKLLTEAEKYWEEIEKLGGADKLRELGEDPSKLTAKEQLEILTKARKEIEEKIVNLGGIKKLKSIGVENPDEYSPEQQYIMLTKGRVVDFG